MYERKILLGFIHIHILHHAAEPSGIYGVEMMQELKSHGYTISPGTLYPILHAMKNDGVLTSKKRTHQGKQRILYFITPKGRQTLNRIKNFIKELSNEVMTSTSLKSKN